MKRILSLIVLVFLAGNSFAQTKVASQTFSGTSGSLGSSWTNTKNAMAISGSTAVGTVASVWNSAMYSGATFINDQYCLIEAASWSGASYGYGCSVREQGNGDNYKLYCLTDNGSGTCTSIRTYYYHGGTMTALGTAAVSVTIAPNTGTLSLLIQGSTLKMFANGTQVGTNITDTNLTTGTPGITVYGTPASGTGITYWEGGNILPAASTPTFTAPPVNTGGTITITPQSGCSAYTYWSSTHNPPTTSDTQGTTITMGAATTTYYAKTIGCPGYADSAVGSATYSVTAVPVASVASGPYFSAQSVVLTDATSGAAIKYCTNPTTTCDPTSGGNSYIAAISVSSSEYLCYYATASGYANSPSGCSQYTINPAVTWFYTDPFSSYYHTDQGDARQKPLDWFSTSGMWTSNGGSVAPDGSYPANIAVIKDANRSGYYMLWKSVGLFGSIAAEPNSSLLTLTGYSGVSTDQAAKVQIHSSTSNAGINGAGVHCDPNGAATAIWGGIDAYGSYFYLYKYIAGVATQIAYVTGVTVSDGATFELDALGTNPTVVKPTLNGAQIPGAAVTYSFSDTALQSGNPCLAVGTGAPAAASGGAYNFSAGYFTGSAPTFKTWGGITSYPTYGTFGLTNSDGSPNASVYSGITPFSLPGKGWWGANPTFSSPGSIVQVPGTSTYGWGPNGTTGNAADLYGIFGPNHGTIVTIAMDTNDASNKVGAWYIYVQHSSYVPHKTAGGDSFFDSAEYFANVQPDYPVFQNAPAVNASTSGCGAGAEFNGAPFLHIGKATQQSADQPGIGNINCAQDKNLALSNFVPELGDRVMFRYDSGWLSAWCKAGPNTAHAALTPGGVGCPSAAHWSRIMRVYDTDLLNFSGSPAVYSGFGGTGGFPAFQNISAFTVSNSGDPCYTSGVWDQAKCPTGSILPAPKWW